MKPFTLNAVAAYMIQCLFDLLTIAKTMRDVLYIYRAADGALNPAVGIPGESKVH